MNEFRTLPDISLAAYLQVMVPGFRGPLTSTKFTGGQSNPTYLIEAESGEYVLRRKPSGPLLASAHAVDREFRVLMALSGSKVPVARPLHLCTDDSVIGSIFYLMSYIPGEIFFDPALPDLSNSDRSQMYSAVIETLSELARLDVGSVGLSDFGKSGNYFARQVGRWTEQYRAAETERIEAMESLIAWLPQAVPPDDGRVALVHGDFRIDNLIWDANAPRIAAVVDWELSTLGHPFSDIAYFCMALRLPRNPTLPGLASLDRAQLGIPDENELVSRFVSATRIDPRPHWNFLLAFHFFRLTAIAQGVLKRAQQGNASNEHALQAGAMTRAIAEMGWRVANEKK
jgi:aminoglycoside phosphotransferase (APT) family kinase protein